ncbi:MAG: prepilin-type N-terminal cleavage/methylation domain-containing protein [Planctomycetes bacterium]|nr:prepilin-type N-terminal cleavage/methylation domain-containing protein [Planctomycetota bacterium]
MSNPSKSGFTIIEVLVAISIFMFGISALLGLFHVGGNFEQQARVNAELAPAIEPLINDLQRTAFTYDALTNSYQLMQFVGEQVPLAPAYKYDLFVEPISGRSNMRNAQLRFYKKSPERVLSRVSFVLLRQVPISLQLQQQ